MALTTSTYTFRDLVAAAAYLQPGQTLLMRGRHGIGKSDVAYQLAEEWGHQLFKRPMKVIERRVAQLSEGDMLGLPDRGAHKLNQGTGESHPVTQFLPTDWFLEAMFEPCVIFLDEINRGTIEVQQACFQVVEKGELNGRRIHKDSRIIAACNNSREYQVSPMDPAFLDRFWIADVEPDKQDWMIWARGRGKVHPAVIEFINQCNDDHFEIKPEKMGKIDPNDVTPSRRSWARLDRHLTQVHSDPSMPTLIDNPNHPAFYHLCKGFVGPEAARAFMTFMQNRDNNLGPDDVLRDFVKNKARIQSMKNEALVTLVDKLWTHLKSRSGQLTDDEGKNLSRFMQSIPDEVAIQLWNNVSKCGLENAATLHKYVAQHFMRLLARTKVGESLPQLQDLVKEKK